MTLISFSCIRLTSPRTQISLLEFDRTARNSNPKQNINSDIKKHDFDTDRLFLQRLRGKPENTKLSIIINYILNSNEQL